MNKYIFNIGLVLAVLLLLCLLSMPYGYYVLVRFVSMIIFGIMAWGFYNNNKIPLCILFASLALLFQPFLKIALGRFIWNVADIVVAVLLISLWYLNNISSNIKKQ